MTSVEEAVKWLSYTYLYVRMRCNPLVYGVSHVALQVSCRFDIVNGIVRFVIQVDLPIYFRQIDQKRFILYQKSVLFIVSSNIARIGITMFAYLL